VDPFAVLGVTPGASAADIAAAYRAAAKRWHPDVTGADEVAATRMAELNAAYDAIRNGDAPPAPTQRVRERAPAGARTRPRARARGRVAVGHHAWPARARAARGARPT
jgi:hypothetical protein